MSSSYGQHDAEGLSWNLEIRITAEGLSGNLNKNNIVKAQLEFK